AAAAPFDPGVAPSRRPAAEDSIGGGRGTSVGWLAGWLVGQDQRCGRGLRPPGGRNAAHTADLACPCARPLCCRHPHEAASGLTIASAGALTVTSMRRPHEDGYSSAAAFAVLPRSR